MAIQYIPGWWDQIGGDVKDFLGKFQNAVMPDQAAQQKFEQIVQKNPEVLNTISNFTPEQRAQYAKGLGARNTSIFDNIPAGAELQKQQREGDARKRVAALPWGQGALDARDTGTPDPVQREQQNTLFDQTKRMNEQKIAEGGIDSQIKNLNVRILTSQAGAAELTDKAIAEAMKAYPHLDGINFRELAKNAVRGTAEVDPQLMTAIRNDPGAAQLYDVAKTAELKKYENELALRLAKVKDPNTNSLYLRTLTELGNQYNDQEARLLGELSTRQKELQGDMKYTLGKLANPEQYKQGSQERKQAEEAAAYAKQMDSEKLAPIAQQITSIRQSAGKNRTALEGLIQHEVPGASGAGTKTSSDPLVQYAYDAIKLHPESEAQIRASYKTKTGKDLP